MPKYVHVSSDTNSECELGVALENMIDELRGKVFPFAIEGREVTKREVSKWLADGIIIFHTTHLKGVKSLNERFPRTTLVRHDVQPRKAAGQFPFAIGDGLLLVTNRIADRRPAKHGQDKRYVYFLFAISTALENSEMEGLQEAS